jgi:maltooligosyltrehalose trehalohydrolase
VQFICERYETLEPMSRSPVRRFPIGAEVQAVGGTHFRVWAPSARAITLVIQQNHEHREVELAPEGHGYHSASVADSGHGSRYWFRLDGELLPDPASRFQPDGPFGASQVIDSGRFRWSAAPPTLGRDGHVIYEVHVGTFTPQGTWRAAAERLDHLAQLGITVVEVMPVSEFPGQFGWGYDGVFPFAPARVYGSPDDFRAFVDAAHHRGIAVILDVVYNHLGPDGCVFAKYAPSYFGPPTEWGGGLNFDGPCSGPVREYFSANAAYWIEEFKLDGLRLDATQSIRDESDDHIIRVIVGRARQAAGDRRILIVAENEPQRTELIRRYDVDMLWNDDFHHSAVVALTGRREAYYSDYCGSPQELISAAKHGFLYQGQRYEWQKQPRGTRTDGLPASAFVNFIENHDQVANSGDGSRLWMRTSPGCYRALTAFLLLMPGTPMLFQGQEFGSSAPFLYFADHRAELAAAVHKGRMEFMSQFRSFSLAEMQRRIPAPHDTATFERCKLDWSELGTREGHLRLHTDLLALRKSDSAFRADRESVDGAVLAPQAFVLRFSGTQPEEERLLIVNLGPDLRGGSFAEPLMAPPAGCTWAVRWSSEHPEYGGLGNPWIGEGNESILGQASFVLKAVLRDAA